MTKILVVDGPSYGNAVVGLGDIVTNTTDFINNPKSFDLVLFTGGYDITPSYYGDTSPRNMCYNNEDRDRFERYIFNIARTAKIRMVGICRGLQFLNVMAGGQLFHDVNNHSGTEHLMSTANGEEFGVNSLHHQMVIPPTDAKVIGWSTIRQATRYYGNNDVLVDAPSIEYEAVLFPSIKAAGAQYHPEMMLDGSKGKSWFHTLVDYLINEKKFSYIVEKYLETPCQKPHQHMHVQQ